MLMHVSKYLQFHVYPTNLYDSKAQADEALNHLKKYKLRSKVNITDTTDSYNVWSVLSPSSQSLSIEEVNQKMKSDPVTPLKPGTCVFTDPRHINLGIAL